mmetsp:Transcript_74945/g.181154  ORF Transcript_74945/g.181154 Transcript_74945/m.181154 type:complete len:418 (-) Transcript_74945:20-1273(-)
MAEKFTGMIPEAGIIPLAAVTMLYTMIGGFPASIVTDWVQAGCIMFIVLGICIGVWSTLDVKQENWEQVSTWSDRGFEMAVSLSFAVFGAEVFNLAFWQRIYAAKDVRQLRIGFVVGAAMVSVLTFLFGVTGMLLKAQDLGRPCGPRNQIPAFIFFEVLEMPESTKGLRVALYVLVVCMIASNADSFQTAITSIISRALQQQKWPAWKNIAATESFVLAINVPAILFAVHSANDKNANFDGLAVKLTDLFSMADILTITLVVPLFSGLWPFVTAKGAMAGMSSGILFIMAWGWVEFHTLMGGMEMITMMCFGNTRLPPSENGAPTCGFYASRAIIMFPLLPVVTGAFTFIVSFMERSWMKAQGMASRLPSMSSALPVASSTLPCVAAKAEPPAREAKHCTDAAQGAEDSDDEDPWSL